MIDDSDELCGAVPTTTNIHEDNKNNASFGDGDFLVDPAVEASPRASFKSTNLSTFAMNKSFANNESGLNVSCITDRSDVSRVSGNASAFRKE